jgi:hypothetical protein
MFLESAHFVSISQRLRHMRILTRLITANVFLAVVAFTVTVFAVADASHFLPLACGFVALISGEIEMRHTKKFLKAVRQ